MAFNVCDSTCKKPDGVAGRALGNRKRCGGRHDGHAEIPRGMVNSLISIVREPRAVQCQNGLNERFADVPAAKVASADEPVTGLVTVQFTADVLTNHEIDHESSGLCTK